MSDSEKTEELERIREQKREKLESRKTGTSPEASAGDDTPNSPVEIASNSHFEEMTTAHNVVLVDCYADWCGPCQMMEPAIDSLAAKSAAAVVKIDVDRHQGLARQLGAEGVPTLVAFSEGEPVERVVGAQDRTTLEGLIQRAA